MDGGELADSIMTFTEERPANPKAFRHAVQAAKLCAVSRDVSC